MPNLNGTRRVLYSLPRVIEAVAAGRTIYVVEGEKDVHAIERAGETCNPGGAGKWREDYSAALAGAKVVVADRMVADAPATERQHRTRGIHQETCRIARATAYDAQAPKPNGRLTSGARPRSTSYSSARVVACVTRAALSWAASQPLASVTLIG